MSNHQPADIHEVKVIQEKMQDCIRSLARLAPLVGAARQIKEFSSDQRKNVLAIQQSEYVRKGESVSAAETLARSNEIYLLRMEELEKAYASACATIAEWEATFARFEACRSMGAMLRETIKTLEG